MFNEKNHLNSPFIAIKVLLLSLFNENMNIFYEKSTINYASISGSN